MEDRFNKNYLSVLITAALFSSSLYGAGAMAAGIAVDPSAPA